MIHSILRQFYYALSPGMRLIIRRLVYLPYDIIKPHSGLVPPRGLIYTGRGDFEAAGLQWRNIFIEKATFPPDGHMLDIGSGIGRIALGMTGYLSDKGSYQGFDAVKQGVDWCRNNITKNYPNFAFDYIDLHNDLYKSSGINAATFKFPFKEKYFDLACAISVFTHMLPEEVINYLNESAGILRQEGYLVATFFIMPEKDGINKALFKFPFVEKDHFLMDKKVKSANVAYERSFIEKNAAMAGLKLTAFIHGSWRGMPKSLDNDFQDILIFQKTSTVV